MESITVGYNENEERQFIENVEARIKAFEEVYQYLRSKGLRVRKKALYGDLFEEMRRAFYDANGNEMMNRLSYEKALELFEFNVDIIHTCAETFEGLKEYEFEPISYKYELPDFSIVLTDEIEIKRYNVATRLIEILMEFREERYTDLYGIVASTRNAIVPDLEKGAPNLKVNLNYVKGLM